MKRILILIIIALVAVNLTAQKKITRKDLKDKKSKLSYYFGLNVGKQIKAQGEDIDINAILAGIKDGITKDSNYLLTNNEINEIFQQYQKETMEKMDKNKKMIGAQNKIESEKFLAENKNKEGVVVLPSGLQYKVIKSGEGKTPVDTNRVKVHYAGRLIDGREFDSSIKRGEPIEFPVRGLIKGWQEALKLMKVGDKWELYIPPELGYGENGAGDMIGPNAALIFDLELLDIVEN